MVRRMIPYRIAQEKPMIKSCLKVFLSILLNANAIIGGMIDHANPLSFANVANVTQPSQYIYLFFRLVPSINIQIRFPRDENNFG